MKNVRFVHALESTWGEEEFPVPLRRAREQDVSQRRIFISGGTPQWGMDDFFVRGRTVFDRSEAYFDQFYRRKPQPPDLPKRRVRL